MSQRLLICGLPGTGKTSIGDYLMSNLGFLHIDIEKGMQLPELNTFGDDIVVTWGFAPDDPNSIAYIDYLRSNGFKLIWLDGNRVASRNAFILRNDVSIEAHDIQIKKIDTTDIINKLNPTILNPFDEEGTFKSKDNIVKELLE